MFGFSTGLFLLLMVVFSGIFNKSIEGCWNAIKLLNKDSGALIMITIFILVISFEIGFNLKKFIIPVGVLAKKEKKWFNKVLLEDPTDMVNVYGINKRL